MEAAGIGGDLKLRRILLGLSQTKVAELAGIYQPNLSQIESGVRGVSPEIAGRVRQAIEELAKNREGG